MIGLAPLGRVRPWKLAAAVTALQRAFPQTEVRCERRRGRAGYLFVIHRRGGLFVSPAFFDRCPDEAAIEAAISKAATAMGKRGNPEFRLELV